MLEQIFRVIEEYHMIAPGMRVIAGVSGGADSVFLLRVLMQYQRRVPFELTVVHVEHGLRGKESLEDAAFVENLCAGYHIPCRVVHAQVLERMSDEKLSCEEAGRAERYRIFEEIRKELNAQRIAVAHNQNDQAETVLWNLARGSGLKGLCGIRPVQGYLIRPLLFTERDKIEEYLKSEGLIWRTDRTNLEEDYTRNRIRHLVIPLMESRLNNKSAQHIANSAQRLLEVQDYIEKMTDMAASRCIVKCSHNSAGENEDIYILLEPYMQEERLIRKELLKRALSMCSGMKDIEAVHLEMLEELAYKECGKMSDLPGNILVIRENGILRFHKKSGGIRELTDKKTAGENESSVEVPVPGNVRYKDFYIKTELIENSHELEAEFLNENKYTKWFSYDTIDHSLHLRTRKSGDYLVINARGGTKKLNDYFTDQKIPQQMRGQIPLLADGSHILWIIGYRISWAAKVTSDTKNVLKIHISEGEEV